MRLKNLFKDLEYVGEAAGDRLSYAVFRGPSAYLVVSPNSREGFNVNVVRREAPEVIRKRFHGRRVTTGSVVKASRRRDLFPSRFTLLNSLYVMVALRWAKKLKEREGRSMVFKIG